MCAVDQFSRLFEPGSIGTMQIGNRIIMAPMATNYAGDDGQATDLMIDHYEQRAKGGVGLIITEGICPDFPRGKGWKNEAGFDDDKYIPGYKLLAEAVHRHGAKIAMQLHHAGRLAHKSFTGIQPVAPSPIQASPDDDMPRELTVDEINDLVKRFALAASRARQCGFDGVEIHGAHGYLICQFISRLSNKRTDEYGGTLPGRARFLLEVIRAAREAVGSDFPLWCRINTEEMGPESISVEELQSVAKMAVTAGCDAISVSVYGLSMFSDQAGALVPFAAAVKKEVSVPVITVGALTPEAGDRVLSEGKADFIAMARALLCDPALPNKLRRDQSDEIVPCIRCLKCLATLMQGEHTQCSVNATLGRGYKYPLPPAPQRKQVLIAGGGPTGMEAARVAALRGHDVTLYDSGGSLGGQLLLGSVPPHKEQLESFRLYLAGQMRKLKVKIEKKRVTAWLVDKVKPDAVVVATGIGSPVMPRIPGLDKLNPVFAADILSGENQAGERVAVIGGGLVGCETALFLAEKGRKVTVIEILPQVMTGLPFLRQMKMIVSLHQQGITLMTGTTCTEALADGLSVCGKDGKSQVIAADTVVIATGSTPDSSLYDSLKGKIAPLYLVGDAVKPRSVYEAVKEGFKAGLEI
jgi:2,4-dienoyl-CoA reductase-like NADH-dependent reductase (Old Yellow Enzyme family)/thioredoxin reductase